MNNLNYDKLFQLSSICGVSLSKAATRAGVSARAVQMWRKDTNRSPRPDIIGRVWNAVIEEASDSGRLSDIVKTRLVNELGVSL